MPSMMDIFAGSDDVVTFDPVGPEDVEAAKQESDYVSHVFMNENPGFMVLYSFIKDALLSKVGIVKVFWEKRVKYESEHYYDLDEIAYGLLQQDEDIEIVEHTEHPDHEATTTNEQQLKQLQTIKRRWKVALHNPRDPRKVAPPGMAPGMGQPNAGPQLRSASGAARWTPGTRRAPPPGLGGTASHASTGHAAGRISHGDDGHDGPQRPTPDADAARCESSP